MLIPSNQVLGLKFGVSLNCHHCESGATRGRAAHRVLSDTPALAFFCSAVMLLASLEAQKLYKSPLDLSTPGVTGADDMGENTAPVAPRRQVRHTGQADSDGISPDRMDACDAAKSTCSG